VVHLLLRREIRLAYAEKSASRFARAMMISRRALIWGKP
jgi:hypothetical protein